MSVKVHAKLHLSYAHQGWSNVPSETSSTYTHACSFLNVGVHMYVIVHVCILVEGMHHSSGAGHLGVFFFFLSFETDFLLAWGSLSKLG